MQWIFLKLCSMIDLCLRMMSIKGQGLGSYIKGNGPGSGKCEILLTSITTELFNTQIVFILGTVIDHDESMVPIGVGHSSKVGITEAEISNDILFMVIVHGLMITCTEGQRLRSRKLQYKLLQGDIQRFAMPCFHMPFEMCLCLHVPSVFHPVFIYHSQ